MPTLGLYQSLPMTVDNGLKNYFKGNYFLSWGIIISFRRLVNRSIRKGFSSYCNPFQVEQLILLRFDCKSRYCFLNPTAKILVSGVSFFFHCAGGVFMDFFFFCSLLHN